MLPIKHRNNVTPPYWYETEYGKDGEVLEEKLLYLASDMLTGNIQPMSCCEKAYKSLSAMRKYMKLDDVTSLDKDWDLQSNRHSGLVKLVASEVGVSVLLGIRINKNVKEKIFAYARQSKRAYEAIEQERASKNLISVHSASMSTAIFEADILWKRDTDEVIVCKRKNYDNHGMLDNSDDSAVFLGAGSGDLYHVLANGNWRQLAAANLTEYIDKITNKGYLLKA